MTATQCHLCKNINRELPYWQFLASDFSGWGLSWRGVQVTLRNQVLQQVDQGSTGVSTSVKVDHIVGATELKERLQLADTKKLSNVCSGSNELVSLLHMITIVLHNQSTTIKEAQVLCFWRCCGFQDKRIPPRVPSCFRTDFFYCYWERVVWLCKSNKHWSRVNRTDHTFLHTCPSHRHGQISITLKIKCFQNCEITGSV